MLNIDIEQLLWGGGGYGLLGCGKHSGICEKGVKTSGVKFMYLIYVNTCIQKYTY